MYYQLYLMVVVKGKYKQYAEQITIYQKISREIHKDIQVIRYIGKNIEYIYDVIS